MPETKDHTKEQGNALQEIINQRYEEVKTIRSLGVDPYPAHCEKKQSCLEAKNSPEGAEVTTAGRIMQLRSMGKAAFAHLRDFTGRVQLYVAKDNLGDEAYQFFKKYIPLPAICL